MPYLWFCSQYLDLKPCNDYVVISKDMRIPLDKAGNCWILIVLFTAYSITLVEYACLRSLSSFYPIVTPILQLDKQISSLGGLPIMPRYLSCGKECLSIWGDGNIPTAMPLKYLPIIISMSEDFLQFGWPSWWTHDH